MSGLPRHGKSGAVQWNMMRSQGVEKGEPDIAILVPRGGFGSLVLEHKAEGQSHKLTAEQQDHLSYHESVGNCAVSTRGVEAAKAAIKCYMESCRER